MLLTFNVLFAYSYLTHSARNNICTWGLGWGFQLNTEHEVPLHQAKKKLFSLVKGTVCARRKYTSISFYRLFISFTLTVMCNLVYMYWSSFAIRCQAQTDERDKWLDRLHPVASCKYTLLAE